MIPELIAVLGSGSVIGWALKSWHCRGDEQHIDWLCKTKASAVREVKALKESLATLEDSIKATSSALITESKRRHQAEQSRDAMRVDRDRMSKDLAAHQQRCTTAYKSWPTAILERIKREDRP